MTESPSLIYHLGCGDGIYALGGVVELLKEFGELRFPRYYRHVPTFTELLKLYPSVEVVPVQNEHEMFEVSRVKILAGVYNYPFDHWRADVNQEQWRNGPPADQVFYEQIGVPIEKKWDSFPWLYEGPDPRCDGKPYIFVHDDASRGYIMDLDRIGRHWTQDMMVCPDREFGKPITEYAEALIGAHEIHAINSSIMWFCEFLPLPENQRRYLHRYARPYRNCDCFHLRHRWTILD